MADADLQSDHRDPRRRRIERRDWVQVRGHRKLRRREPERRWRPRRRRAEGHAGLERPDGGGSAAPPQNREERDPLDRGQERVEPFVCRSGMRRGVFSSFFRVGVAPASQMAPRGQRQQRVELAGDARVLIRPRRDGGGGRFGRLRRVRRRDADVSGPEHRRVVVAVPYCYRRRP